MASQAAHGYACGYGKTVETSLEYLAPEIDNSSYVDVVMPYQIANLIDVFVVASMPYQPPTEWQRYLSVLVTVRWMDGENRNEARYRVNIDVLPLGGWGIINGIPQLTPDVKALLRFAPTPEPVN
jgi:hypothetical protein